MKKLKRIQAIKNALDTNTQSVLKYLQILLCLHAVSIAVSLADYLPLFSGVTAWADRVLAAGMIICLFALAGVNSYYRIAGIARVIILLRSVVFALLPVPVLFSFYETPAALMAMNILSGIVLVLFWLAAGFEYYAHSELSSAKSEKLAKHWIILLVVNLLVAVIGSAVSAAVAHLSRSTDLVNTVHYIVGVVSRIMDLVYLWSLYRLFKAIRN